MGGPFVIEGSTTMREGESRVFSVIFDDFTTISTGGGGTEGYINGSSDSASLFTGSTSVTGNTLTLPTFTVPVGSGGTNIVLEPTMSADSQVYKTGIVIYILKPGTER